MSHVYVCQPSFKQKDTKSTFASIDRRGIQHGDHASTYRSHSSEKENAEDSQHLKWLFDFDPVDGYNTEELSTEFIDDIMYYHNNTRTKNGQSRPEINIEAYRTPNGCAISSGHISKEVMTSLKASNTKGKSLPIEALLDVLDGTIQNDKLYIAEPLLDVATAKERIDRILDYYGLSYHIYRDRRKNGWDALSAATTPKQTKKGQPITDYLGNHFDSVTDMCAHHHIEPNTYYHRRRKGWNLEESLMGR